MDHLQYETPFGLDAALFAARAVPQVFRNESDRAAYLAGAGTQLAAACARLEALKAQSAASRDMVWDLCFGAECAEVDRLKWSIAINQA